MKRCHKFVILCMMVLAGCFLAVPVSGKYANRNKQIILLFYDRNGKRMSAGQVRRMSDNGKTGFDNDALVSPKTLKVTKKGPLYRYKKTFAFHLPRKPAALALNWPTKPGGYSLIILDNKGRGFSKNSTVNFTYQAALDTKRKLDSALGKRKKYVRTKAFKKSYRAGVKKLRTAMKSSSQSIKGKYGQLALDQFAAAFDIMLADYGPAYARANRVKNPPWIGFTIDRRENYKENCDLAASLGGSSTWIRVVFDKGTVPSDYAAMIRYAKSKGLKILGQPVDSSDSASYTYKGYLKRFKLFVDQFPQIDAWEIGNEVNGSWTGSGMPRKLAGTAAYVRKKTGKLTVLTFFWQLNTAGKKYALFNWMDTYVPVSVRKNIDCVFLSQYQEQAPVGVVFDQMMTRLRMEFPNAKIGLGELGYWIPGQRYWWAYSKKNPNSDARHAVCRQYYRAALGYKNSVCGGFWWNFCTQFPGDRAMQNTIRALSSQINERQRSAAKADVHFFIGHDTIVK